MSRQRMDQGGRRRLPIGERLWETVREVLTDHSIILPNGRRQPMEFTPPAEDLMRGFIEGGVRELHSRGSLEPEIVIAENNIRKFTDDMAGEAERQGANEIDEIIFSRASSWWCPKNLWPFC